eukprot:15327465-Ditylum_brightwellii.AAC.1
MHSAQLCHFPKTTVMLTATKTAVASQALPPDSLYWWCYFLGLGPGQWWHPISAMVVVMMMWVVLGVLGALLAVSLVGHS